MTHFVPEVFGFGQAKLCYAGLALAPDVSKN